ncbi:MAG: hypothetical protein M0Q23_05010 [Syntrophales bacterium]|nr:hypothetical protein [Syntrophales bacterium]MCK9528000.1 hypothetical protein [Syntrophales bacterium]MDX9921423.1 hypothetical protein [Syntrophales bacterium]
MPLGEIGKIWYHPLNNGELITSGNPAFRQAVLSGQEYQGGYDGLEETGSGFGGETAYRRAVGRP